MCECVRVCVIVCWGVGGGEVLDGWVGGQVFVYVYLCELGQLG